MSINSFNNFILTPGGAKASQKSPVSPLELELSQLGQFSNTFVNYTGPQLQLDTASIDSDAFSNPFPFANFNGAPFNTPTTIPDNTGVQILQFSPLSLPNPSTPISTSNPVTNPTVNTGFLGTSNGTSFFRNPDGTTSLLVERPLPLFQAIRNLTDSAGILNSNPANLGVTPPEEVVRKMIDLVIAANPALTGAQPGTILPAQTILNISPLYGMNGLMKAFAEFLQEIIPLLTPKPQTPPATTVTPAPAPTGPLNASQIFDLGRKQTGIQLADAQRLLAKADNTFVHDSLINATKDNRGDGSVSQQDLIDLYNDPNTNAADKQTLSYMIANFAALDTAQNNAKRDGLVSATDLGVVAALGNGTTIDNKAVVRSATGSIETSDLIANTPSIPTSISKADITTILNGKAFLTVGDLIQLHKSTTDPAMKGKVAFILQNFASIDMSQGAFLNRDFIIAAGDLTAAANAAGTIDSQQLVNLKITTPTQTTSPVGLGSAGPTAVKLPIVTNNQTNSQIQAQIQADAAAKARADAEAKARADAEAKARADAEAKARADAAAAKARADAEAKARADAAAAKARADAEAKANPSIGQRVGAVVDSVVKGVSDFGKGVARFFGF